MEETTVDYGPSWSTLDVGLATALVCEGYEMAGVNALGFRFWDDEKNFKEVVDSYRNRNLIVNGREFYLVCRLLQYLAQSEGIVLGPTHE